MSIREYNGKKEISCYRGGSMGRGSEPSLSVITPRKNWVFAYTHLLYVEWDPSGELVVVFATHQVSIRGRNLKTIYEYLGNFSLSHIYQEDPQGIPIPEGDTWIEEIRVIPTQEAGE